MPSSELTIEKALVKIKARWPWYELYERYYEGRHDLSFATEKFRNAFGPMFAKLAYNHMPLVVDTMADRLTIVRFAAREGEGAAAEATETRVKEIWERNRMDQRAGEVHVEAGMAGDAYVIVWKDEKDEVVIHPNSAKNMTVVYDEERPGLLLAAAKMWLQSDGRYRLNLYYRDRIEKWVTKQQEGVEKKGDILVTPGGKVLEVGIPEKQDQFEEYRPEGSGEPWPVTNPYGVVPVFHFANNAGVGHMGRSELAQVIPAQKALNKIAADMMVSMEYNAFRQRWATGLDIQYDDNGRPINPFEAGPGSLWVAPASEDGAASFGEFGEVNTSNYLDAIEFHQRTIAIMSSTPLHFIVPTTDPPSGEALKTLEAKFTKKIDDRGVAWGNVWEDVMAFALLVEDDQKVRLSCEWEDPSPVSDTILMDTLLKKREIGVPDRQLLAEAGYTDEQIEQWEKEAEQKRLKEEAEMKKAQAEALARRDAVMMQAASGQRQPVVSAGQGAPPGSGVTSQEGRVNGPGTGPGQRAT